MRSVSVKSGPLNSSNSKGLYEGSVGGSAVAKVLSVKGGNHGADFFFSTFLLHTVNFSFPHLLALGLA